MKKFCLFLRHHLPVWHMLVSNLLLRADLEFIMTPLLQLL